jgi:hypothetical protein
VHEKLSNVLLAKEGSLHHQTGLKFKDKNTKMLHLKHNSIWCWALQKVDLKHLKSSEMWCWTKIEIGWTERVRNGSITLSQEGQEYPTYNKKKEG